MPTFMARFVKPNGERGVIYVMAMSAALAMVDVMKREGPLSGIEVKARRRAALLITKPGRPIDHV